MILHLSLDFFYVNAHPMGSNGLVVLRDGRVLDADLTARAAKVNPGMRKEDARALLPAAQFIQWRQEVYESAQRQWLDQCLPYSDRIEPLDQHRALIDLSGHPRVLDLCELLLSRLPNAEAGLAPSRWIAISSTGSPLGIAKNDPAGFVFNLPIQAFLAVEQATRDRLQFLGYRTIGEVARIPTATLRDQFGDEAVRITNAARGLGDRHVDPLYPSGSLSRHVRFEGAIEDSESLRFGLVRHARELFEAMVDQDVDSRDITLHIELEDGRYLVRHRVLTRSLRSPASLLAALSRLLNPLPEIPITSLRTRLADLKPTCHVQRELGAQGAWPSELSWQSRKVSLENSMGAVKSVFGDLALQKASELPEQRRRKVLRAWSDAIGWR